MDVNVIKKTTRQIEMEVIGEDHTFMNALKGALLEDERVEMATYDIKHPTISNPVLYVKASKVDPITVIKDASDRVMAQCEEFKKKYKKQVKKAKAV